MELGNIIQILWRRKFVILVTLIVTVGVAGVLAFLLPDQYRVGAMLRIPTPNDGGWSNTIYADRLNNTYMRVINSDKVMDILVAELDLEEAPEIDVQAVPNSELLMLETDGQDPAVLNTLIDILMSNNRELYFGDVTESSDELLVRIESREGDLERLLEQVNPEGTLTFNELALGDQRRISTLEQQLTDLQTQYTQALVNEGRLASAMLVVQPAEEPEEPVGPRRILIIAFAIVLGGVAGVALAFISENLDPKLYSSNDIQALLGYAPIGRIPRRRELRGVDPQTPLALEPFRQLRTNLVNWGEDRAPKVLVTVSPDPKEGKSTITAHLALAFARSGKRVLVIDGDVRRPTQHELFGVKNEVGLTSFLNGRAGLSRSVQQTNVENVWLLSSGPVNTTSAELLNTSRMHQLMRLLPLVYDVVLVDSPALLAVADATELAVRANGALVVITRRVSTREGVRRAMDQLGSVKVPVLGVVINNAEGNGQMTYYQVAPQPSTPSTPAAAAPTGERAPKKTATSS